MHFLGKERLATTIVMNVTQVATTAQMDVVLARAVALVAIDGGGVATIVVIRIVIRDAIEARVDFCAMNIVMGHVTKNVTFALENIICPTPSLCKIHYSPVYL